MALGIPGKTAVVTRTSSATGSNLALKSGDRELYIPVVDRLIGSKH